MLNKKRIAIFVGFLCCLFFMTTFAGGTTQNTAIATRQVTFIDGYNNSTVSEQTIEVGTDAEVPDDPKHDNFVFAGWYLYDDQDVRVTDFTNILENLTVIAKYAGDLNGNGIADDNETRYTVTFVDSFDNRVLGTDTVLPGMSATAPVVPAHDGRTFVGWNVDYTNVNGNITTNTVYNLNQNVQDETVFHNVTFIDSETDEVIAVVRVADGLTAQAPVSAVHANRVFDYWDGNYNNVTSDRTITAVYTDDLNNDGIKDYLEQHYTVEFIINGQHGQFANDAILTYENIVAGLTFDQIGIVLPSTVLENEHYEALWSEVRNGTLVPWNTTNIGATVVNGNLVYAVSFVPDVDDNSDGIADADQAKSKLTISYVSINEETQTEYVIEQIEVENVLEKIEYSIPVKTFDHYTEKAGNPTSIVMPNHDMEVKIYYHVKGDDNDKNGRDDSEEYFDLNVQYISRGTSGEHLLDTLTKTNVKTGTVVNIAKDFPGYLVDADQPTEVTITNKDESIVIYYHVDGDDKDNNGRNDSEEYFDLTVRYVSKGTDGEYLLGSFAQTDVKTGTTVSIAKDFPGYLVNDGQPSEVTITDKDENITVYYHVDGDDSDNNGRNDAEEYFALTVHYVSQGTNGSYDLGTVVEPKVKMGTNYNLVKDFDGYRINDEQDEFFTMPNHDAETTVYYHVDGNDENGSGRRDDEEMVSVTVRYLNAYGKEIEANTQLSVLAGTTPTINAKDIVNYTPVQSSVSPLIPFGETYTVDMEYTANITGIVVKEEEGKSLQFSVGADESELRNRIHVYLQDADGVLREEVTDYTTDFDSYKSTSREHQLRIDYNYNGTHFSDTSLVYILVAGEVSENGFDLTYTEGARTYKVNRYGTGTIIGGTKDSDPVDYEFLELTKNYFGNVEMVSATAHYEGNKEAKLEISNRVRYYMYGVFTGNYYNSVFIVKRSDNKDIVKDGESKLETIELTYRKDGSLYIMSFRYENNAFHVESTQKVD